MLTLDSTELPIAPLPQSSSGGMVLLSEAGGSGLLFAYDDRSNGLLDTTVVVEVAEDGSLTAPEEMGAIASVTLDGITYIPATEEPPEAGTFTWNPETGQVIITGVSPTPGRSAVISGKLKRYSVEASATTEVLDIPPDWFDTWNISGSFRCSRSLGEQPSGSFSFVTLAANELDVRTQLKNKTKLEAFGIGLSVSNIAVTRLPIAIYPDGFIQVEVSLTGCFAEELDLSVKTRDAIDLDGGTISSLAQLAEVPYSGGAIALNASYSTPASVSTTLGNELESRAITVNGFAFYSSPNNVQVRTWAQTRSHILSPADLLSPVQIALNGRGSDYEAQNQNNQLAREYKNTRVNLDANANESDRQRDTAIWIEDADELYASAPPEFNSLASDKLSLGNLSHNFDSGGVTKERTRTLYRNGTVQKTEKYRYGFTYKGVQVYAFEVSGISSTADVTVDWYKYTGNGVNPQAFWGLVETIIETYNYESSTGYLRSVSIDGLRLARLKQEQDAVETIKAQYAPTISLAGRIVYDGNNLREAYRFRWLPSSDFTRYSLASYLGLYPDVQRQKDDPNWVEPLYAAVTRRTVAETLFSDSPDPNKPVLTAGRSFTETKRVVVNYPSRGSSNWQKEFEQYTVHTKTTGSQGQDLKDSLNIGRRTENLGRPSTHTRIDIIRPNPNAPQPQPPSSQVARRALLNSPNNGTATDDPEEGSVSFPGVFDYEKARSIAQTSLSIENTRGTETWQVTIAHSAAREMEEGDRVHLFGKVFVILSLDEDMVIQGNVGDRVLITSAGVNLSLGLYLNPPITLTYDE